MTLYIRIQPGNLGNQMFHYMLAQGIADQVPRARIVGQQMPEWRLSSPAEAPPWRNPLVLPPRKRINVSEAIRCLQAGQADGVDVQDCALRLEYFGQDPHRFREVFYSHIAGSTIADDEIAISVPAGDIAEGSNPDCFPLPLSFYSHLIAQVGLRPVFVGRLEANWYNDALRDTFAEARFLALDSACEDFQTLRHARHKVVNPCPFSWLAAWLSPDDSSIYYPLAGLLNPLQRPQVDLRPSGDSRYRFYRFPLFRYTGEAAERAALLSPQRMFGDYATLLPEGSGDRDIQTPRHA